LFSPAVPSSQVFPAMHFRQVLTVLELPASCQFSLSSNLVRLEGVSNLKKNKKKPKFNWFV
jgi:hypothetical protein